MNPQALVSSPGVYLVADGHQHEIIELERQLITLQTDSKALQAYTERFSVDRDEPKRPYALHEGVAIIEMKGPLVARTTWMSLFMGATSYEDIRNQVAFAITDEEVKSILFDVDTPGGQVNGIGELSAMLDKYKSVKPMTAYGAGGILSAGYWVCVSMDKILASKTSFIGSIGVVFTHTSYQAMLEKEGIKITKIKSGEFKQVGSQEKDLSEKELAYLEGQVNDLFTLFKSQVLSNRAQINTESFNGSEYVADKALAMGLIDKVDAFDDVLANMVNKLESGGSRVMAKSTLTAEQIAAAAASGAKIDELDTSGLEASSEAETSEETTEETTEASSEETTEETTEETSEETTEASSEETSEETTEETSAESASLIKYLEAKVGELTEATTDLTIELKEANKKVEGFEASIPQLKGIVADAMNKMHIALNHGAIDLENAKKLSTSTLIAEYEATLDTFNKTFKPSGLLKGNDKDTDKPVAVVTNIEDARCRSVGMSDTK